MRIYLTGFMGSGKTTVGRILASDLGCFFVDLDAVIEQETGRPVAAIFEEPGEGAFRTLETQRLKSIIDTNTVVSTGGGCFVHNTAWMLANGLVVYLEVPFDDLASRIGGDPSRPLWRNARALYRDRESIYKQAHHTVDASGTPQQTAALIANITAKSQGA